MRINGMVSAIMPTYNRVNWLPRRINELDNQTYQNWELIIINDASTDGTKEYLDNLNHPKVKVIHLKQNSNTASIPRGIGISYAQGEFIAPIDDDNYDFPKKFEVLAKALKSFPQAVLVYGNQLIMGAEGIFRENVITNWNPALTHGVDNGQMMYRASCYDSVPIIFPWSACDWNTAKHICHLGDVKHIDADVSIYVRHPNNRQKKFDWKPKSPNDFLEYFNPNCPYKLQL